MFAELRTRQIRDLVKQLRVKQSARGDLLAPRTVRHVYSALRTMLQDAVVDELIDVSPCAVRKGELPGKIDRDPLWRPGAVFTRDEVESLISDERIPEDRRVVNALLFLAGLRFGECAALRWRVYDPSVEPLGKLVVATSFNVKKHAEKSVTTERPREVPVHPTLASVLATWKLGGWQELMGRPGPPVPTISSSPRARGGTATSTSRSSACTRTSRASACGRAASTTPGAR